MFVTLIEETSHGSDEAERNCARYNNITFNIQGKQEWYINTVFNLATKYTEISNVIAK